MDRRGEDHVESDQLLHGPVVNCLGHLSAHLALLAHGALGELPGGAMAGLALATEAFLAADEVVVAAEIDLHPVDLSVNGLWGRA